MGGVFLFAARAGWLPNYDRPVSDVSVAIAVSIFWFIVVNLAGITLEQLEHALQKAHCEREARIHAEEELRHLNNDLESRVAERTAQLAANEKLLRLIGENIHDVIWITDLELNTTFATPSAPSAWFCPGRTCL